MLGDERLRLGSFVGAPCHDRPAYRRRENTAFDYLSEPRTRDSLRRFAFNTGGRDLTIKFAILLSEPKAPSENTICGA